MATGSAGTQIGPAPTAVDAQPFPRLEAATARQEERFSFRDAQDFADWLNAAQKSSPSSYWRVLKFKRLLEQTRAACAKLQNHTAPGLFAGPVCFLPIRNTHEYRRLRRTAERLHSKLNESLARYTFRPRLTFYEFSGLWGAGLVSDSPRKFRMKSIFGNDGGRQTIAEADAVLILTRLDQIERVRLCSGCHVRWLAARKSDHEHCSKKCREILRNARPDYLRGKRERQREYRRILRERGEA
jgi:hypothetical protein